MTSPVLDVKQLRTVIDTPQGMLPVVNDVSLTLARGKVLGVVGESGSGKSMLAYSIMNLLTAPLKIAKGEIIFQGQDLCRLPEKAWQTLRGNRLSMVFQDAMQALNPLLRIETHMVETLRAHQTISHAEALKRARTALVDVGIAAPDARLRAYPHQFSGGMRQRVAIALALLNEPDLVIADEPTTALDVTLQRQILNLMKARCQQAGTSLLWITHDFSVVAEIADEIAVMYAGKVIEQGPAHEILHHPQHPYTRGLLAAIPGRHPVGSMLPTIKGTIPALRDLPPGCAFQARCEFASPQCEHVPTATLVNDTHTVYCWHPISTTEITQAELSHV